jgi:hypothetical protein
MVLILHMGKQRLREITYLVHGDIHLDRADKRQSQNSNLDVFLAPKPIDSHQIPSKTAWLMCHFFVFPLDYKDLKGPSVFPAESPAANKLFVHP